MLRNSPAFCPGFGDAVNYTRRVLERARKEKGIYHITVVKNGISVTESITPANKTNNCYSVAKAFTVTALGILYDDGLLSPDEKPIDIFRNQLPDRIDPKWEQITLDHVIRHRWGIGCGFLDIDSEDVNAFEKKYGTRNDFLKIVFSTDLPNTPGDEDANGFVYSDAAYYLLSRVVSEKTGKTLFDFMRERLFVPCAFQEFAWSACPMGYSMGATGLYIRTPDMAKLGRIYLNGGVFDGKRYISKEWCDIVFERGYELKETAPGCYAKGGMCGQMLFVDRNRNAVVAWQGFDNDGYSKRMLRFITESY